jgi:PilZ domain
MLRGFALKQTVVTGSAELPVSAANQPPDSAERRKSKRFAVSASAELLEPRTSTRLNGRVSDLGMGGCYIDTVTPFPLGTSLLLNLTSQNYNVRAKANVVYAHTGMGMGLAFTEITASQRENLAAWLAELNGETPKEPIASASIASKAREASVPEPQAGAKSAGLRDVLQELVSLLENKRVLSEDEVELLREKLRE